MFENPYVVLVTGSRFYDDLWAVKGALDAAVEDAQAAGCREFVLRHGACFPPFSKELGRLPFRSADYLAHLWFRKLRREGMPMGIMAEQLRPADWDAACRPACQQRTHRERTVDHRKTRAGGKGSYCPDAGKLRNRDMILEEPTPTVGIAFERDNSGGTAHCVRTMRQLSIPVIPVPYAPRQEIRL